MSQWISIGVLIVKVFKVGKTKKSVEQTRLSLKEIKQKRVLGLNNNKYKKQRSKVKNMLLVKGKDKD